MFFNNYELCAKRFQNIYLNISEPDNFIDGPTDEELRQIEQEIEKYSN